MSLIPGTGEFRNTAIDYQKRRVTIYLESTKEEDVCPHCGTPSKKVKTRYTRKIKCGHFGKKEIEMDVEVKSFKCENEACDRKSFTQNLEFAERWQQRTKDLNQEIIVNTAQSGFRGSARNMGHLGVSISHSSVRRLFSRIEFAGHEEEKVEIAGIDDLSLLKGQSYMTAISDLTDGAVRLLALTEGRAAESVAPFLARHLETRVIARDRSTAYSSAAKLYRPDADEVADRYHLIANCEDAVEAFLRNRLPRALVFVDGGYVADHGGEEKKAGCQTLEDKAPSQETMSSDYTKSQAAFPGEKVVKIRRKDLIRAVCSKFLSKKIEAVLPALLGKFPCVGEARGFWESFYKTIMGDSPEDLDMFIEEYGQGYFASFVNGINKDKEAVRNAIVYKNVSSGPVEGLNNKIKLIKRCGYGNFNIRTLEKMVKLSYHYYHGSMEFNLKPTAQKHYEVWKSKRPKRNIPKMVSWFEKAA